MYNTNLISRRPHSVHSEVVIEHNPLCPLGFTPLLGWKVKFESYVVKSLYCIDWWVNFRLTLLTSVDITEGGRHQQKVIKHMYNRPKTDLCFVCDRNHQEQLNSES